jgi:hypothetical protein
MNEHRPGFHRQGRPLRGAAVVTAAFVAISVSVGGCSGVAPQRPTAAARVSLARPTQAELTAVEQAQASARALAAAPGMPTCTPPPLPTATYPPGASYGIPFLAAVTDGQILTGYDEWTANHRDFKVKKKTYLLYPWQSKIYDITGWVTGLLELPSLDAVVQPNQMVFCDQGGEACESASPPAGECIRVILRGAPVPGQAPQPATTNVPAPGKPCYQQTSLCIPYVITLTPVGTTELGVTGVGAGGTLSLTVKTSATTTLSFSTPTVSSTCTDAPTSLALSSTRPAGLPAGAPVTPDAGNPDFRGLRVAPAPLTGPLGSATTTLASNDFSVPAFSPASCPFLAAVFDSPLAGWNALPSTDPSSKNNNYFDKSPLPADAGTPGWVQFSATTTISDIGLPTGPPGGRAAYVSPRTVDGAEPVCARSGAGDPLSAHSAPPPGGENPASAGPSTP